MIILSIITILFFITVFIIDLKYRLIPNRITISSILIGWLFTFQLDPSLFIESLLGTLIGFLILLYPYVKGGVGGGDVKFLAAVGSLGGIHFLLHTMIWGSIVSMLYSLYIIYKNEGIRGIKRYSKKIWKPAKTNDKSTYTIPLGSCISVGGILILIIQMW